MKQRLEKNGASSNSAPDENFFGRKEELLTLRSFIMNDKQKVFCVYGVPMIGKSTLVRQFCNSLTNFISIIIKFNNPESPKITLAGYLESISKHSSENLIIVIQNFEEALLWKGDFERIHEIIDDEVRQFIEQVFVLPNAKIILESRFQIKLDFLPIGTTNELPNKQLGRVDRRELYNALNAIHRHKSVSFEAFEEVCEKLNDHIWLIELAMQDYWNFEDVREAISRPESITQKLWDKIQAIIRRLSVQERTLLCIFSILNPTSEETIVRNTTSLSTFSKKNSIYNGLTSLRKKLLLSYEVQTKAYELNPFLREVCFSYLSGQKEMSSLKKLPFYNNAQLPKYNLIIQAHERGDYDIFFKLIKEKRAHGQYDLVLEILREASYTNPKPAVIFNEIGVTYKWMKNYTLAIDALEKALDMEPDRVQSLNELAIIYKEQKNYAKSIKISKMALEVDSKDVKSLNEIATVYRATKDYFKAIDVLELALSIEPMNVKVLNELAMAYNEVGDHAKAMEHVNKGLEIDGDDLFFKMTLKKIKQAQKNIMKINIISDEQSLHGHERLPIVVILTAIKEEFDAVKVHLLQLKDVDMNDTFYEEGIFKYNNTAIAQVFIRECGPRNTIASLEAERAIHNFKPDYMFFVGIAGSRKPNDFKVGDVIVPDKIYSYEGGKSEKDSFKSRPDAVQLSYPLAEIAKRERGRNKWKRLIKHKCTNSVKADLGTIASGEQLVEHYDSEVGRILTAHFNDTQAVEMEGFGFGKVMLRQGRETGHIHSAVVRGISDIISQNGYGNEAATTDTRPADNKILASATAAAFAFWMIYQACTKKTFIS